MLIAGGGPAGLAAAAELSLHGVPCIVIEPRTQVSHRRPRAKTTSIRTMEHLRRWGIAGRLRSAAPLPVAWSQRVVFCESLTGQRITEFDGAFGLTQKRDDRFAEPGQQVPQPVVEDVLRAHLRARPGVQLRAGHTVTGLAQDDDGVTVTVGDGDGSAYAIRARYVLGCDGASGVVRDQIGVRFAGRSDPRPNFNVVFRAPGLDTHLGAAVQYWVVGGRTTGLIGRLDLNGTWWAGLPGIDASYGNAHASELITGLIGKPAAHQVLATDPWTARLMLADTFAAGRVFLAGEAAHVNPPWGGHGFNTSVGDAVNIAWKIAAVEQRLGAAGTAGELRSRAPRCGRADSGLRRVEHGRAGGRPARRRGGHPAGEEVRVLQPRPGPRLLLRGIAADPARHTAISGRGLHQLHARGSAGGSAAARDGSPTARRSTTGSAPASRCSARRAPAAAWRRVPAGAGSRSP